MNLQWILLALFLVAIVSNVAKSMRNPMLKNVLRLISVFVAFIITFILQISGLFQDIATGIVKNLELAQKVPRFEGVIENAIDFVMAFCTTFLSPLLFALVFFILYLILRILHVNLVYRFIVRRQRRKEIRAFKRSLREEKDRLKRAITENEERFLEIMQEMSANNPELATYSYETLDEDEIERMVEKRLKAEKKNKKRKPTFFRESGERKAISIVCGVVAGFILFAVTWMGLFYTMDVLGDITSIVDETAADDNRIYQCVEMVDNQLIEPYENSFVYKLYKNMGMVNLMNSIVKHGGRIDIGEERYYADTIMRDELKAAVRLACEMTSGKENAYNNVTEDMTTLTTNPAVVSILADVLVVLLEDMDVPEENPDDPIGNLWGNILRSYKEEGNKEVIISDLSAMSSFVGTTAKYRLIQKVKNGQTAGLMTDKDLIKDLVINMSELSFYAPSMNTIFTFGVDALGGALVPANGEEGYQLLVDSLVGVANDGVTKLTDEELADFEAFMIGVATYEKKEGNDYNGLLGYIVNPLYTIESIQQEAKEYKAQADAMLEDIEKFNTYTRLLAMGNDREEADQILVEELQAWVEEKGLTDPIAIAEEIARLQETADGLLAAINDMTTRAKDAIEEFKSNINGFKPFITYLVNWMNMQKPFMVANEDFSTACLAIIVEDDEGNEHVYVCNIDEILTLERILDLWNEDGGLDGIFGDTDSGSDEGNPDEGNPDEGNPDEGDPDEGNPDEGNPDEGDPDEGNPDEGNPDEGDPDEGNPDEGDPDDTPQKEEDKDSVLDFDIDKLIDESIANIPESMQELLGELLMFEADPVADAKRVSEHTDLINYLIYAAIEHQNTLGGIDMDTTWLYQKLAAYSNENACSDVCECMACRIYAAQFDPARFDYIGVTIEAMHSSIHFGDEWTTEDKRADSAKLADIVFSILGLVEHVGADGDTDIDMLLGLLESLGSVMDQMADTTCLGELPEVMLEAILKNEKLSVAMTPEMLYGENGYLIRIKEGNITYKDLMTELAGTVETILGKFEKDEGGN